MGNINLVIRDSDTKTATNPVIRFCNETLRDAMISLLFLKSSRENKLNSSNKCEAEFMSHTPGGMALIYFHFFLFTSKEAAKRPNAKKIT